MSRISRIPLWVAPVLLLAQCGAPTGNNTSGKNDFSFVFVNNSADRLVFTARSSIDQALYARVAPVPPWSTGCATTTDFGENLTIEVGPENGSPVATQTIDPPLDDVETTFIKAIWNSPALYVTSSLVSGSGLSLWKLVSTTGVPSATWSGGVGTADGRLTGFTVPEEVEECQTVPVSVAFSGTVTLVPPYAGQIPVDIYASIQDGSPWGSELQGSNSSSSVKRLPPNPTAFGSVSDTVRWNISANNHDASTLTLKATGQFVGSNLSGTPPILTATYVKER